MPLPDYRYTDLYTFPDQSIEIYTFPDQFIEIKGSPILCVCGGEGNEPVQIMVLRPISHLLWIYYKVYCNKAMKKEIYLV